MLWLLAGDYLAAATLAACWGSSWVSWLNPSQLFTDFFGSLCKVFRQLPSRIEALPRVAAENGLRDVDQAVGVGKTLLPLMSFIGVGDLLAENIAFSSASRLIPLVYAPDGLSNHLQLLRHANVNPLIFLDGTVFATTGLLLLCRNN